jgi:hypothetical protein
MRSLEKVAKDKGWVKQEDMIKSAAPQIDLTPSGVLSIDILKLCSGLRYNGFHKYADEIELKFVNYKRAATSVYDTTGETGEDLVDAAHPKGSHKMEDVAGDATFHTIVDKHLKMLDVVNKEPKGKLANNIDILNAVKTVLGQETSESPKGSSIGETAVGIGAGVGGTALLKYVWNRIQQAGLRRMISKQVTDAVLKGIQGDITKFQADAITKQLVKELGSNAGKVLGEDVVSSVAGNAAKSVGTEVVKNVAQTGVKEVIKDSPGIWSRLLGGAARIGGAEIGGGVAGSVAAFSAAVLVGAIAGAIVGNELFDHYLAPAELKDAGEKLYEAAKDSADALPKEAIASITNFKQAFDEVMANYPVIQSLKDSKKPEDLLQLKKLRDALLKSNQYAISLSGWGRSALADQKWYQLKGFGNLVALGVNYSEVVDRIFVLMTKFIQDADKIAQQNQQNTVNQNGGQETAKLTQDYQAVIQELAQFKDIVEAKQLPADKTTKIVNWITAMNKYVSGEKTKFDGTNAASKPLVAKDYDARLNEIKTRIQNVRKKLAL